MKVLTLALLLSLPGTLTPHKPLRQPTTQMSRHGKGGRWYFPPVDTPSTATVP